MKGESLFAKGILMLFVFLLTHSPTVFAREGKKRVAAADSLLFIDFTEESRFNFSFHSGYALALGSNFKFYPNDISLVSLDIIERNVPTKTVTYNSSSKGLGEGFRVGVGLSYIINDFMNVGVDIDYFRSSIKKTRDSNFHQAQTVNNITNDYAFSSRSNISYTANIISFTPAITFKAITRTNWLLYNKVGAVIVLRPKSVEKEIITTNTRFRAGTVFKDSAGSGARTYEWAIKNPALGLATSLGFQLKITEQLRGFCEIQFSHVVFQAKKRSLTAYSMNGKNLLPTLPVNAKELVFLRNYTASTRIPDPNLPSEAGSESIPVTYAGLQLGVTYRF